ncbi:MAG: serine/threonine protein kinase, partial [Mycobacteriaceae bacterium]|nr:serine/threonine protein kinase [Mycobacteriaceae bacterium]
MDLLDGRYRVDAIIATGGMSAVYRGLDTRLDRPVAIKMMDSRYAGDQQFLTRFAREARAVARLKDPGLVAVYDQGVDGQHPFLVMELVEGGTLRELLRERGPMPPHAVAAVLRPVLGGLAVAHRSGLVHRDVKPENVLISDDGEVKIADFGLVRAVAEAKITSDSVILGTAAYLSPEQVSSGDASPRSDVYACGIMVYELLTGVTPFDGDSPLAVAYARMDRDVRPPSTVIRGVPTQFDYLVRRATARDAGGRFADAEQMAAELDVIVDELGLPDFRVPAPRRSAQHASAALSESRPAPPQRHPTRQMTVEPWVGAEIQSAPRQFAGRFAGIELSE